MWLRLRHFFLPFALVASAVGARGQEMPTKGEARDLQKEAGELIDGLPELRERPAEEVLPTTTALPGTVEQEQKRLEQARRKQQRWEKLARQGVLSKAESEQCVLEVSTATVRFEKARLARSQAEWDTATQRMAAGQGDQAVVDAAAAALKSSQALTATAEAQWNQTRLTLAQVNLERHRRLYAERLVTRAAVDRAQSTLAKVQAQVGAP